jgi:hypothetical protein
MMSAAPTVTLPVPEAPNMVHDGGIPAPLAAHVFVLESLGRHGLWCTTTGLGQFGLPELQTLDVPTQIGVPWARVLTGIALRVLEQWIEAISYRSVAFVELPAVVEVTAREVARAYGVQEAGWGSSAAVQLRLDPVPDLSSDWFLTVGAPDGTSGSVGEYLTRVCADLFGYSRRDQGRELARERLEEGAGLPSSCQRVLSGVP